MVATEGNRVMGGTFKTDDTKICLYANWYDPVKEERIMVRQKTNKNKRAGLELEQGHSFIVTEVKEWMWVPKQVVGRFVGEKERISIFIAFIFSKRLLQSANLNSKYRDSLFSYLLYTC